MIKIKYKLFIISGLILIRINQDILLNIQNNLTLEEFLNVNRLYCQKKFP